MWDPETLGQKLMCPPDQPVRSCIANSYEQQGRKRGTLIIMDHMVAQVVAGFDPPTHLVRESRLTSDILRSYNSIVSNFTRQHLVVNNERRSEAIPEGPPFGFVSFACRRGMHGGTLACSTVSKLNQHMQLGNIKCAEFSDSFTGISSLSVQL